MRCIVFNPPEDKGKLQEKKERERKRRACSKRDQNEIKI
jgi:hypothetical protein